MTPSITQDNINTALGNFLQTILPAGVKVIDGQVNRVASPKGDYCVMWPLRRPRLATNVVTSADLSYLGFIEATTMIVDQVYFGEIEVGQPVHGGGALPGTTVVAFGTGDGGAGSYEIQPGQTAAGPHFHYGSQTIEQSTEIVMQIDVHGPASGDNAQTISTLFRDEYGVRLFAGTGVTPLYCEDPRQMPFTTAASQYEDRYTIDVHMQADPTIGVPQQYADEACVTIVSVEAAYPA